jgi:hypothetical protein
MVNCGNQDSLQRPSFTNISCDGGKRNTSILNGTVLFPTQAINVCVNCNTVPLSRQLRPDICKRTTFIIETVEARYL